RTDCQIDTTRRACSRSVARQGTGPMRIEHRLYAEFRKTWDSVYAADSPRRIPRLAMRPEEVHVPPTRTVRPDDLRPPSIGLAERRRPLDARGGSRAVSRRRAARGTSRPRHRRRLVEAREVPHGPSSRGPGAALSLGREPGELRKAVCLVFRRGVGRGARHLRPPGGGACDPLEVHMGWAVLGVAPRT